MAGKPNILYLHSHDTGRYIQPYGHAVPTPNLQRLAEEGVLFRQCFCANPTCSASRAGLLTGQSAHNAGMLGLAHRGYQLSDFNQHLIHTLKSAGYTSALAGVQHIAPKAEQIGYDQILTVDHRLTDEKAVEFLRTKPTEPFFLSVGFIQTHLPFPEARAMDDARYCLPPAPLPDTPEIRHEMARFKASAHILDERMGRVLDALRHNGLAENTLVICTTDHGIAFPRMKCNLYDGGIGVMLLMRGPGGFTGGKVCEEMVSHVDIFPTLCELVGQARPAWLQGESVLPWLRGERPAIREEVFAEVNVHAAVEPQRCVRTKRWKYIRRYSRYLKTVRPNCDDSEAKRLWLAEGWREHALAREELYDLMFDPNEQNNLVNAPRGAAALADLRARLDNWMRRTDDPLLAPGGLTFPVGAILCPPDELNPGEDRFTYSGPADDARAWGPEA